MRTLLAFALLAALAGSAGCARKSTPDVAALEARVAELERRSLEHTERLSEVAWLVRSFNSNILDTTEELSARLDLHRRLQERVNDAALRRLDFVDQQFDRLREQRARRRGPAPAPLTRRRASAATFSGIPFGP